MPDRELTLAVVGIQHPNADGSNRRFEIELLAPGDQIQLHREPKNEHDPYAVAVFTGRGNQIGYLRAERAPWIGAKLGAGEEYEAIYQGLAATAAYVRIRFGGGAPMLPVPRERAPTTSSPIRKGRSGVLRLIFESLSRNRTQANYKSMVFRMVLRKCAKKKDDVLNA